MHYLAQELRQTCASIHCLFIQPGEAYFNHPEYKQFRALNKDLKVHGIAEVAEEYILKSRDPERHIDTAYIERLERLYTRHTPLNIQFYSEMSIISYMHDRDYYGFVGQQQIMLYLQLYYRYLERLFASTAIDLIVDCDAASFGRAALLEVATHNNVPYLTLDDARVKNFNLPSGNLFRRLEPEIKKYYENARWNPQVRQNKELTSLLEKIREDKKAPPDRYKKLIALKRYNLLRLTKILITSNITFVKYLKLKRLWLNVIKRINAPICGDILRILVNLYQIYFRTLYLRYSGIFERRDLKSLRYIFVPLHMIPEASTVVLAPYHINETYIIESIAKSIPVNHFIVVKEHWAMIGERSLAFYKRLKRIPNVILIDPEMYPSSVDFIEHCDLVATISGTTALEAAFLGKNSVVFSDVLFTLLSAVKKATIDSGLSEQMRLHAAHRMPDEELLAYLDTLIYWGESVDLNPLMVPPGKEDVEAVKTNVYKLLSVYLKGGALHESVGMRNARGAVYEVH